MKIDGNDGISLKEKLKNILEVFIKENFIDIKHIIKVEPIKIYFNTIIQFLKNNKNNQREFHVLNFMNLLNSKKGK